MRYSLKLLLIWITLLAVCLFLIKVLRINSALAGPLFLATKGEINASFGRKLALFIVLPVSTTVFYWRRGLAKAFVALGAFAWLSLGLLFKYCTDW